MPQSLNNLEVSETETEAITEEKPRPVSLALKISKASLFLLIFLTPLFFLPLTVSPVAFNKQIIVLILVLIGTISYLVETLNQGKIIYPKGILNVFIWLWFLILVVSTYFSLSPNFSLGTEPMADSLVSFILFILVYFLALIFLNDLKEILKAVFIFLASTLILTILSLAQMLGAFLPFDFAQVNGFNPIGSVNALGFFLGFGLVLIIPLLSQELGGSSYLKKALAILAGLLIILLLMINFRLIWLNLGLTMIILIAWQFFKNRLIASDQLPPRTLPLILPMIILVISLAMILVRPTFFGSLNLPTEISPTFKASLEIGLKVLKEEPKSALLGSGPATFAFDYSRYRSADLNQTVFWPLRFNQGSSALITLLATTGLLGFIAILIIFLTFILTGLKSIFKSDPAELSTHLSLALFTATFFLIIAWFLYPANFTLSLFTFLGMGMAEGAIKNIKRLNNQ